MSDGKITSLEKLLGALKEMGAEVSVRKLKDAMDDGCPGKSSTTEEYEPERVKAFLIERGIVKSEDDPPAGDNVPPQEDKAGIDETRAPEGTVYCPKCAGDGKQIRIYVASSQRAFQYFKPCSECNLKLPPRPKPRISDLVKRQQDERRRREPAVNRP